MRMLILNPHSILFSPHFVYHLAGNFTIIAGKFPIIWGHLPHILVISPVEGEFSLCTGRIYSLYGNISPGRGKFPVYRGKSPKYSGESPYNSGKITLNRGFWPLLLVILTYLQVILRGQGRSFLLPGKYFPWEGKYSPHQVDLPLERKYLPSMGNFSNYLFTCGPSGLLLGVNPQAPTGPKAPLRPAAGFLFHGESVKWLQHICPGREAWRAGRPSEVDVKFPFNIAGAKPPGKGGRPLVSKPKGPRACYYCSGGLRVPVNGGVAPIPPGPSALYYKWVLGLSPWGNGPPGLLLGAPAPGVLAGGD